MEKKEQDTRIYSVSEINLEVKSVLSRHDTFKDVWVRGEISNFTHHMGRHMYFILKDDKCQVRCAMFKSANAKLDFTPEEGLEVLCRGGVSLFAERGDYQIVITDMLPSGIGTLYLAFDKLKSRLMEEGLFDEELKKPIPFLPSRVGIVTSSEGAALRDILTVIYDRFPNMNILLAPTPVQGRGAADKIAEAIHTMDRQDVDVIIVGRGGGSIEDLWCFNEEVVARAIFSAKTPVISAVGHETDVLISDFVADLRAPTPSAAAEMAVPRKEDMVCRLQDEKRRCVSALKTCLQEYRLRLERESRTLIFTRPEILLEDLYQMLDINSKALHRNMREMLKVYSQELKNQRERLKALGPLGIMERGYCAVIDKDGATISRVEDIACGDRLKLKMIDGELDAKVIEVKKWKKK